MIWIVFILVVIALILGLQSRSTSRRTVEDIDEIRNSLYELRTTIKSLRAEWNLKNSRMHVNILKSHDKIPKDRIPYFITKDCIACGSCLPECPTQAISEGSIYEINPELCVACKKCAEICPVGACQPLDNVGIKESEAEENL